MATLLIGYDLNKTKNYADLIEKIKSFGTWWHHLDSTWLVNTSLTAIQMRDALKPYIDADDELLVLDVTSDSRAWTGFSSRGSNWLKSTHQ